ncbi:MAG: hypothetical protein AB8I08_13155 [Sandaracinaceae bacterium]
MRMLFILAVLSVATPARAQTQPVVHQRLVALLNPMGMEHSVSAGLRNPLGDPDSLFFEGAHTEVGVRSYVSPVYAVQGGYVEVSPLSFLVLSFETTGTVMWPIGMDGAGYYPLNGYHADVQSDALPGDAGESATGWEMTMGLTLQGALAIGPTRLLVASALTARHATLGASSHYYSLRHDLVLAARDWVIQNEAVALVQVTVERGTTVLLGAYDQVRYVPRSGYVGHQVGPMAALSFEAPDALVSGIDVFVRGGMYSDHVTRAGQPTVLGGVNVHYGAAPEEN